MTIKLTNATWTNIPVDHDLGKLVEAHTYAVRFAQPVAQHVQPHEWFIRTPSDWRNYGNALVQAQRKGDLSAIAIEPWDK